MFNRLFDQMFDKTISYFLKLAMAFALRFLRKKVSKLQMIDRLETINPKILRQSLKQILRKKDICKMSEHNTDKSNDVETKFEAKYKRSKKV